MPSLLRDKPPVPVSRPSQAPPPPRPAKSGFGGAAVGRLMKLEVDGPSGWVRARFEATAAEPAEVRWVLPSPMLATMEDIARREPSVRFRTSGETLEYRGLKFFLPAQATAEAAPQSPQGAGEPAASAPAETQPAVSRPDDADARTPEVLMRLLLAHKPGKPVLTEAQLPQEAVGSVAPPGAAVVPTERAPMVADRLIRLSPEAGSGWMTARFESDNTLQEPPMRLLPCRHLDRAERLADDPTARSVVLRVSGDVLTYRGKNYLLLRKVLRERELKQF